jgi:acyl-coenzyme A synthetase/AMP-(fatty) acid ligase
MDVRAAATPTLEKPSWQHVVHDLPDTPPGKVQKNQLKTLLSAVNRLVRFGSK